MSRKQPRDVAAEQDLILRAIDDGRWYDSTALADELEIPIEFFANRRRELLLVEKIEVRRVKGGRVEIHSLVCEDDLVPA